MKFPGASGGEFNPQTLRGVEACPPEGGFFWILGVHPPLSPPGRGGEVEWIIRT